MLAMFVVVVVVTWHAGWWGTGRRGVGDYDTDILTWSEHQAALLRRVASGEQVNESPDWPNIIDEVESVGRSQLSAVRSLLMRALEHMLKAEAWPLSSAAPGWQAEARRFRFEAAEAFAPSMRQRIDLAKLYQRRSSCCPRRLTASRHCPCRRSVRSHWTSCWASDTQGRGAPPRSPAVGVRPCGNNGGRRRPQRAETRERSAAACCSAHREKIGGRALCHWTAGEEFHDQSFRFALAQRRQITAPPPMCRGLLMRFGGGLGKPLVLFHDRIAIREREIKPRAAARRQPTPTNR